MVHVSVNPRVTGTGEEPLLLNDVTRPTIGYHSHLLAMHLN